MLQTNHTCLPAGKAQKIYYTLRIASAMCFIGHGAFGIITKAIWCNYFGVFGIGHNAAYTLMPYVGAADICFGILILFYPLRIIVGWLVVWGVFTALLRPLSGEPFAEFIERAGNYGAPLALLLLTAGKTINVKQWFKPLYLPEHINKKTIANVTLCLRIVVFLLFLGHGWLSLIEKGSLLAQYTALGFSNTANTAHIIGAAEIFGAVSILIRPLRFVILILLTWKIMSELFYPQYEIFEWIERAGSYGSILALWFLTEKSFALKKMSAIFITDKNKAAA